MRNRLTTVTAALLLASAAFAAAQTPPPTQPAAGAGPSRSPIVGSIDFGGAFGDVNGDAARYERYRDTRNGVYTRLRDRARGADTYAFDAMASHIGYRDQRYTVALRQHEGEVRLLVRLDSRSTTTTTRSRRSRAATRRMSLRRRVAARGAEPAGQGHPVRLRRRRAVPSPPANAALAAPNVYNNTAERRVRHAVEARHDRLRPRVRGHARPRRQRQVRDDQEERGDAVVGGLRVQQHVGTPADDRTADQRLLARHGVGEVEGPLPPRLGRVVVQQRRSRRSSGTTRSA